MKVKILRIFELNGILRVHTECIYGKDNLGLSLDSKYLDPTTGKPRYLKEIKMLLEKKYDKELAKEKDIPADDYVGKEIDLKKI